MIVTYPLATKLIIVHPVDGRVLNQKFPPGLNVNFSDGKLSVSRWFSRDPGHNMDATGIQIDDIELITVNHDPGGFERFRGFAGIELHLHDDHRTLELLPYRKDAS